MKKFIIGDRVRVIDRTFGLYGRKGVITKKCKNLCENLYWITIDGNDENAGDWLFKEYEIITEKENENEVD